MLGSTSNEKWTHQWPWISSLMSVRLMIWCSKWKRGGPKCSQVRSLLVKKIKSLIIFEDIRIQYHFNY